MLRPPRSIWYYCYTLYAAKKRGCKVMMYGCGIGPINRPGNRRMAARTIDTSVDRITLRDDNSRALLAEMGVTRPDIRRFRPTDHHSDAGAA